MTEPLNWTGTTRQQRRIFIHQALSDLRRAGAMDANKTNLFTKYGGLFLQRLDKMEHDIRGAKLTAIQKGVMIAAINELKENVTDTGEIEVDETNPFIRKLKDVFGK